MLIVNQDDIILWPIAISERNNVTHLFLFSDIHFPTVYNGLSTSCPIMPVNPVAPSTLIQLNYNVVYLIDGNMNTFVNSTSLGMTQNVIQLYLDRTINRHICVRIYFLSDSSSMCKPRVTNIYVQHTQGSVICYSVKVELDYYVGYVVCIFECTCFKTCDTYFITVRGIHVISDVTTTKYNLQGSCS